jgi:enamine deaminase RidA (YjgF/YER057c/UK114 family)
VPSVERIPAASGGSYSDAVVVESGGVRWIHIAGQTPRPPAAPDLEEQTERVFDQIAEILEDLGSDLSALIQITVYLTDLSEYSTFAAVRARRLGDHRPTSAAVQVAGLLDHALVEIAAVAVADA